MTRLDANQKAARAVQRNSKLTYVQALEWVRENEGDIRRICTEQRVKFKDAALAVFQSDEA